MHYELAEYKWVCHLRDSGYIGMIDYPDKKSSKMDPEGNWILIKADGEKVGKVFKDGKIV